MNVQLILVQAGIELAREVLTSPVTRRLLIEALCKITSGRLCLHRIDSDGLWKSDAEGQKPTLILQGSDADGNESTLSCGVEHAQLMSGLYWANDLDKTMAEVKGEIPSDYAKSIYWLTKDQDLFGASEGVQVPWISWDDFRLDSLDAFEQFLEKELFKASAE